MSLSVDETITVEL